MTGSPLENDGGDRRIAPVIGTFINAAALILGGLGGSVRGWNLSSENQRRARLALAGLAALTGLAVVWRSLPPHWGASARLLLEGLVALSLGTVTGKALGLQRGLSRLLDWTAGKPQGSAMSPTPRSGFAVEAVVFAANPLGWAGAVLEGWTGDWRPLALKSALDAFAALGFAAAGSRTVALAAVPVLGVQGILVLGGEWLSRVVLTPGPSEAFGVCAGLLVLSCTPVVLGIRKVSLANALPALVFAPGIEALWR
ncbi:MAG: DUF554 domain-containing protein [Verrucomicrobiales bacterium]|nr:DUF554 domain-containing protein [Verrucomicrobiales bacterium]